MAERVLWVEASARTTGSVSRALSGELVERLGAAEVVRRDLADGVPLLDETLVGAFFTEVEARSPEQRAALAVSDALVAELRAADTLVIATPIYNFGVPAALKAWVDLVARARETFRYTADGPEGLLTGKRAYLVVASGGTEVGGPQDFATGWLRRVLAFLGITDVEVVAAEKLMAGEAQVSAARAKIEALIPAGVNQ